LEGENTKKMSTLLEKKRLMTIEEEETKEATQKAHSEFDMATILNLES